VKLNFKSRMLSFSISSLYSFEQILGAITAQVFSNFTAGMTEKNKVE